MRARTWGGFRTAEKGTGAHWASYLSVDDVERSFAAATQAGASAVMPPTDYGDVGRAAVVKDPTGAMVCLWRGAQDDPQDVEPAPFGGWIWNELWSSDAKAAVAFYEKALGFSHVTMDMGPGGTYYILRDGEKAMRSGIMQQPPDSPLPSLWLPYIHVADCDAASTKAMQLGAIKTIVPPSDIPGIGRFTVLIDPLGAPIGLIKGAGRPRRHRRWRSRPGRCCTWRCGHRVALHHRAQSSFDEPDGPAFRHRPRCVAATPANWRKIPA